MILWFLAQGAEPERLSWSAFYWSMVIMAMLGVGLVIVVVVRRRAQAYQNDAGPGLPFTLHDLRQLHDDGQLTDEEFERARSRIVSMSKAQLNKPTPAAPPERREIARDAAPEPPRGDSGGNIG
jgi:hypothetical protein